MHKSNDIVLDAVKRDTLHEVYEDKSLQSIVATALSSRGERTYSGRQGRFRGSTMSKSSFLMPPAAAGRSVVPSHPHDLGRRYAAEIEALG